MPHVAANTQGCWQRYINRPLLSASLSNFRCVIQIRKHFSGVLTHSLP